MARQLSPSDWISTPACLSGIDTLPCTPPRTARQISESLSLPSDAPGTVPPTGLSGATWRPSVCAATEPAASIATANARPRKRPTAIRPCVNRVMLASIMVLVSNRSVSGRASAATKGFRPWAAKTAAPGTAVA